MTKRELEEAIRERNEAREELAAAREAAENGEEAEKKIAAYRERLTKAEASAAENEEKATAAEEELSTLRTELREAKAKAKRGSGSAEDKARIAELEAALKKAGDTSRWEFAAGVKGIQEGFNGLLRLIEGQEEEAREKYQTALKTLLSEMLKLLA